MNFLINAACGLAFSIACMAMGSLFLDALTREMM